MRTAAPTRPLRILHTSDVHIGAVVGPGERHGDACCCPVTALVSAADEHQVDVLLIAGDLFDHARLKPEQMEPTFAALRSSAAEVLVIAGNHDVHNHDSPWGHHGTDPKRAAVDEAGLHFIDQPDGDVLKFSDLQLTVWARAMTDHHIGYRPLQGAPAPPTEGWYVVAGHGHYVATKADEHRSSPITADEIAATRADYVALGHFHVTTDVSAGGVEAWYAGAPFGRPSNQTAALVQFEPPASNGQLAAGTASVAGGTAGERQPACGEPRVTVTHVPLEVPQGGCP